MCIQIASYGFSARRFKGSWSWKRRRSSIVAVRYKCNFVGFRRIKNIFLLLGVWESLHVTNEKMSTHSESLEKFLQDNGQIVNGQFNDILEDVKGSANNHIDNSPHSPHHEDDHRSGKNVIEKDLKGKDWNCPSCLNLNWSWRTNCNMCGTMKPNASAVRIRMSDSCS